MTMYERLLSTQPCLNTIIHGFIILYMGSAWINMPPMKILSQCNATSPSKLPNLQKVFMLITNKVSISSIFFGPDPDILFPSGTI